MKPLMLHNSCDLGPIRSVTAQVSATHTGCEARFRLDGAVDRIKLPEAGPSVRTDNLWKTTCFEIFWQPIGGTSYREFNLSPSGRWAAYDFDSFREGMRDAPVDAIALSVSQGSSNGQGELVLAASIACELPTPAQVALNAIVEHEDESLQFWALAFAPGKPEFHSEACRQWLLDRD
ncbi:hypothetical protein INR77_09835 [Erythrobacter sp. SCSIO 43205]|uniref:hypothetical protein n=1 Tax=Erythrobacter sp. SCSIO 43205 TaxID=2779361 RepID=UPI001CA88B1B|nr:hypothetical protein [Erythrobacter sp. SCSIO 43205]UAB77128.1 hypothetical protein INR77_09835 [Erythrobacter sp. SCSIO 43205]